MLAANPGLAGALRPLLTQHHEHLARLRARLIVPVGGQPLPTPRATARHTAQVPGTKAAALGYLRDAEDAASGALLAHLATAPPSLAQLLASISASEATHALRRGAPSLFPITDLVGAHVSPSMPLRAHRLRSNCTPVARSYCTFGSAEFCTCL